MPILDIQIVTRGNEEIPAGLAQSIATELGTALRVRSAGLWVRVHRLGPGSYAENSVGGESPAPVFVNWLENDRPVGDALATRIATITKTVARLTGRSPEHVHVLFDAAARGRIAFGGELLE
jgi:phenylpyruvate tautomerase PptA (4-oxalocrotonate tautomerase family)